MHVVPSLSLDAALRHFLFEACGIASVRDTPSPRREPLLARVKGRNTACYHAEPHPPTEVDLRTLRVAFNRPCTRESRIMDHASLGAVRL
jgi:hypothetical protein